MDGFFVFGTQRDLAREEVASLLPTLKPIIDTGDAFLFFDADISLRQAHDKLGGTIKTGNIYGSVRGSDELPEMLSGLFMSLRPGDGRAIFGISVYEVGQKGKTLALRGLRSKIGMKTKVALESFGRSARHVVSLTPVLSSVIVKKQGLADKGIEFCLFPTENEIFVGVTETVQDFEEWGHKDMDRPSRDMRRGILPPKLARILVNLAGGNPNSDVLLDPFCGGGTILTEAIQLGYRKIIGSDIGEQAVEDTRENVAWTIKDLGIETESHPRHDQTKIIRASVETLHTFLAPESVNRIVSEVYLGRPKQGDETREELLRELKELEMLYAEAFRSLSKIIVPGGKAVMAFPAFVMENGAVLSADIVDRAKLFNFEVEPFHFAHTTDRGAIRYGRPKQYVWRDIYRLTKNEE
ncbi:MAG: DNA methyltransferase [Patescibacteria group bacterium]